MSDEDAMRLIDEMLGSKPVVFGLRAQGHLSTVERMLLVGASWEQIGREIGWDPATAERFFEMETELPDA